MSFVLGFVVREVAASGFLRPGTVGPSEDPPGLPPERYPRLVGLAGNFPSEDFDQIFESGLRVILVGLLNELQGSRGPASGRPAADQQPSQRSSRRG